MSLRIEHARSDWEDARRQYREEKRSVINAITDTKTKNWVSRELKRIAKKYERVYEEKRKVHRKKVQHLEKRHTKKPTAKVKVKEKKGRHQEWISAMATGDIKKRDFSRKVPVYGGVILDEDERSVLCLPEKLCTYPTITHNDAVFEGTLCNTKVRWSRGQTGSPKEQEEAALTEKDSPAQTEEIHMKQDLLENQSREVYNPESKVLDFRKLRVTDMTDNPRVCMPIPRPQDEEKVLGAKELVWQDIIEKYRKGNCSEKGDQLKTNITKQQKRGIKKLLDRQKKGEIVIQNTDKSGKIAVASQENYAKQGDVHVAGDEVVTWKEVEKAKNEVQCHARTLANVFKMGEDWGGGGESRVRGAMGEGVTIIPSMINTVKDHKILPESGVPKTRPICTASHTADKRVSDNL